MQNKRQKCRKCMFNFKNHAKKTKMQKKQKCPPKKHTKKNKDAKKVGGVCNL